MEKNKYQQLIGTRLNDAFDMLHLSQQQVLAKCNEQGYNISQSAISKMVSGSSTQILQVVQVCTVLRLNLSEILSLDENVEIHVGETQPETSRRIISDARNDVFRGYLGNYYICFYSTKNVDFVHRGTFKLQEDPLTHQCMVEIRFKTGEKRSDGTEFEKSYTGPAYFSDPMRTIYCEVTSNEIGEKCYLLFHYDHLVYQDLECRLLSAITVSSGIKRLPTSHRVLLTRQKLSDEDVTYLCGQLKLNSSEVLITETAYREFLRDPNLPEKFFEYFGEKETHAERFISSVAQIPYYSFNESLISDSFLPTFDKIKIICLLRKYSAAPRYNKISSKVEEIIYNYFECKKKESPSKPEDNSIR